MKILVLGHSGSAGGTLGDPQAAWRHVLPKDLEARIGQPVELAHELLFTHVPGALERADKLLDRHHPDVVIVPLTTNAASVKFVSNRVRQLVGKRAGDWFDRTGQKLDAQTRHRGTVGTKLNEGSRWLAHRLIGAAPSTSEREMAEGYFELLRRLAREENLDVIVLGAARHARIASRENRQERSLIARFHKEITGECARLHFAFVDKEKAYDATGDYASTFYADGIHNNELGHRIQADVLLSVFDDVGRVRSTD